LCPVILGHSIEGEAKALTFQFGGSSKTGLPPGGEWRCLFPSKVSEVELRDGPWHTGESHKKPNRCVDVVDLDIDPDSPYEPKRPIARERAKKKTQAQRSSPRRKR
jgi:hypothetical protein